MKRCTKCAVVKPLTEFFRDARLSDGLQCRCKPCMRAATTESIRKNPIKTAAREMRRRKQSPGRSSPYVRAWRSANPERSAALNAPTEKRRSYDKQRYRSDPARKESVLRRLRELNALRPEIKTAITARRRAAQKNALVPWGDHAKISALYAVAKRLTLETGVVHHVDHIVPLKSPLVCGLHWEGNLQVLPSVANRIKGNKLIEDVANGR